MYRDCPSVEKKEQKKSQGESGGQPKRHTDPRRCFKCGNLGHIAAKCSKNSGYYVSGMQFTPKVEKSSVEIVCWGKIEDVPVEMLVDTGCSHTLVQRKLVPDRCLVTGHTVALQCAHGDITEYPVAEVDVVLEGRKRRVRVGVSDSLPRAVLAGTDVLREFGTEHIEHCMVMTRSQGRRKQSEENELKEREREDGATAKPLWEETESATGGLEDVDDELFGEPGKPRKTRLQRRKEKEA